ncbi:MAG: very short patch repair endonuclease [Marinoscillum sp.]|uniref:very short patch repair endonuclease n=1 Tax=Marinoscillum sp. TaxID=2024838 RepID=UPI003304B5A1
MLVIEMPDVHSPEVRSYNMSQIKGKDSKPEMVVRSYLHANGFRFRLHDGSLPGKPDIVLPKLKTVIQINGCFWHGHHGCKYYVIPQTRTDWWKAKINKTIENDGKNNLDLQKLGWEVITIWECELKSNMREETLLDLVDSLK